MPFHRINGLHGIKAFVLDLVDRADRELCMDQDEWAYRLGWTVTRKGFGARSYRDPRFDRLAAGRATSVTEAGKALTGEVTVIPGGGIGIVTKPGEVEDDVAA
ncbi:hypothetical protein ACFYSC_25885 [Streptosporangium sp. NPDC004379]|uniref:hypothetical protein n=1 Tax=Streptosporangium sp. NPDC004379 TaxID=3366189 RepID=UPI0036B98F35